MTYELGYNYCENVRSYETAHLGSQSGYGADDGFYEREYYGDHWLYRRESGVEERKRVSRLDQKADHGKGRKRLFAEHDDYLYEGHLDGWRASRDFSDRKGKRYHEGGERRRYHNRGD